MTTKRYVYLLNACTDYEGHHTVAAFLDKSDAESLATTCRAMDSLRPDCPTAQDTADVWEKFYKKSNRWAKKHPAGGRYDEYAVIRVELKGGVL